MAKSGAHRKNAIAPSSHQKAKAGASTTHGSRSHLMIIQSVTKSGRRDLNPRPPEPHLWRKLRRSRHYVRFHRGNVSRRLSLPAAMSDFGRPKRRKNVATLLGGLSPLGMLAVKAAIVGLYNPSSDSCNAMMGSKPE